MSERERKRGTKREKEGHDVRLKYETVEHEKFRNEKYKLREIEVIEI